MVEYKNGCLINFKLDYDITEYYKWFYDENGCFVTCKTAYWTIKIYTPELVNEINKKFGLDLKLNETFKTNKEVALKVHDFVKDRKDLVGTFGSNKIK